MGRNYEFRCEHIVFEVPEGEDVQDSLAHVCLQLGIHGGRRDKEIKPSGSQREKCAFKPQVSI